jgi:hypothetical protein
LVSQCLHFRRTVVESQSEHAAPGLILSRELVGGFFEEFLESKEGRLRSVQDLSGCIAKPMRYIYRLTASLSPVRAAGEPYARL